MDEFTGYSITALSIVSVLVGVIIWHIKNTSRTSEKLVDRVLDDSKERDDQNAKDRAKFLDELGKFSQALAKAQANNERQSISLDTLVRKVDSIDTDIKALTSKVENLSSKRKDDAV